MFLIKKKRFNHIGEQQINYFNPLMTKIKLFRKKINLKKVEDIYLLI